MIANGSSGSHVADQQRTAQEQLRKTLEASDTVEAQRIFDGQLRVTDDLQKAQKKAIEDALKKLEEALLAQEEAASEAKAKANQAVYERALDEATAQAQKAQEEVEKLQAEAKLTQERIDDAKSGVNPDVHQGQKFAEVLKETEEARVQTLKYSQVDQKAVDPNKIDNFGVAQLFAEGQNPQLTKDGKLNNDNNPPNNTNVGVFNLDPHSDDNQLGLEGKEEQTCNVPANVIDPMTGKPSKDILTNASRGEHAKASGNLVDVQGNDGVGGLSAEQIHDMGSPITLPSLELPTPNNGG